ncbi:MAG: wax ester/triacylglycerol synthase family O-acyltransferase [Gammaproteobacteria bacterium]|nr:wax ester/triacylglycerol synthase family O-acyltransferase [Gammaproteobacteria bacterium]
MVKLNAQDVSFLALEGPAAPMHIGFLLTFQLPDKASIDYMQKLHDRLMRFPVEVAPFNLRLKQHERLSTLRPELEVDEAIDLEYHLRHEALPWPGGERELGLAISRLHSLPLERSRPLWECTLIEGLQPKRFAFYIKIHHALVDGVGLMHQLTQILSDTPRGASPPPWSAPLNTEAPQKATQAADEDWRSFFEGLLGDIGKPGRKRKAGSYIPRGPRCILNGNTTGRRRFATQWLALARVKAVAKAVDATVNDVVLALCSGALRAYLQEFERIPKDSVLVTVPVALPREPGQRIGNSVAAVHAPIATHIADPKKRLLAVRDAMRDAKEEFNRLPLALNRAISSLGMLAVMMLPKRENTDPDHAAFTNLTISNVPGPKQKRYFNGAEMDGMYPVSVLASDQRLNITVLGYHEGLHFGFTACPDTLPSVQKLAVQMPKALRELERAVGIGRASR